MLRLHVHKPSWRHKLGDKAFDHHICPSQLSQQVVEAKPDNTMDFKVSKIFALETTRNQELVSSIEMRFLELICLTVTQYPPPLCANMQHLVFSFFLFPTAGRLDSHGN